MTYKEELTKAMKLLSEDERVIFIGQAVAYKGTALFKTLEEIPHSKRIEVPVFEDTQMGISIGLSLSGYIPISIFPRMDFLICAANQLVNHLDKMEEMSDGQYRPKVIIRTAIGSKKPLFPGPQHCQDHTEGLKKMLTNVDVVKLTKSEDIVSEYKKALQSKRSSILVEIPSLYDLK